MRSTQLYPRTSKIGIGGKNDPLKTPQPTANAQNDQPRFRFQPRFHFQPGFRFRYERVVSGTI